MSDTAVCPECKSTDLRITVTTIRRFAPRRVAGGGWVIDERTSNNGERLWSHVSIECSAGHVIGDGPSKGEAMLSMSQTIKAAEAQR